MNQTIYLVIIIYTRHMDILKNNFYKSTKHINYEKCKCEILSNRKFLFFKPAGHIPSAVNIFKFILKAFIGLY